MKFLKLDFIPINTNLALLVLRVWLGLTMLGLHGWGKVQNLFSGSPKFMDPIGIGAVPTLVLAVLAEAVCSTLLVLGWFTRLAALVLATTMATAFFTAHGAKLSGQGNGELAFVFLAGFVTLLLAGAGRFSVDGGGKA